MTTIPVERELLEQLYEHLATKGRPYRAKLRAQLRRTLAAEQPQADHSAQGINMVEQPQAGAGRVRRVLLLASYCDENGCTDGAPCIECLRMCNVAMVSGDVSVVGQYDQLPCCCLTPQPPARHDQGDEVRRLREALEFACKSLAIVTSSDGSGHADIAASALRIAGLGAAERESLVEAWKAEAQSRIYAALSAHKTGEEE